MYYNLSQLLKMMNVIGVHPGKTNDKSQTFIYTLNALSICSVMFLVIFMLIMKDPIKMEDVIKAINALGLLVHGVAKLTILFIKRAKIFAAITRFTSESWKVDVEHLHEYKELERVKRTFKIYVAIVGIAAASFYFEKYAFDGRTIEKNLPFNSYLPRNVPFYMLFLYEVLVGYTLLIPIICMDVLMLTMNSLTAVQFHMLNNGLARIFQLQPEDDIDVIGKRMRKCNDHLTFLLSFKNTINDIFTEALLAYIVLIIPTLCVEMYMISTPNEGKEIVNAGLYSGTLFVEFFILYCYPAQTMMNAADETANSIYMTDWYLYPKYYKNMVMILGKSQIKVYVSAGGIRSVDLQTGLAAFKTMISYSIFLRTVGFSQ